MESYFVEDFLLCKAVTGITIHGIYQMRLTDCFTKDVYARSGVRLSFSGICKRILLDPGYRVVVYYRLAVYLKSIHFPGRFSSCLASLILVRICRVPGIEIFGQIPIGDGILMYHPHNIVIGRGTKIGRNVTIYNGVTLGARTLKRLDDNKDTVSRYPTIEDGVTIFSGAKILGPIIIGRNSLIGANSVVLDSFPPNSVIVGAPARTVTRRR